jgi:hypothetical protein
MAKMNPSLILFAAIAAVIGLAVAGRLLAKAVRRGRLGRERRTGHDRRQTTITVPMERRRGKRRRRIE